MEDMKIEIFILIVELVILIFLICASIYVWKYYKKYIQQIMDDNGIIHFF
jgi:hypothetical protein